LIMHVYVFYYQAEDGIRYFHVTGVQTCALPISQQFGNRIKQLYGTVPGSAEFKSVQSFLQPPAKSTDVVAVIKGVIEAEQGAIDHYMKLIKTCGDEDPVTADMVTTILADEEGHMREFEGFLKEYEGK